MSGADSRYCGSSDDVSAGGGGRVALEVDGFIGFDPASQVVATGGGRTGCSSVVVAYGAPGTIYVREATSTYGRLQVDAGESTPGVDRRGEATALPGLGVGGVTAVEVSGSDLWVTAESALLPRWLGAWMVLEDASGTELGGFEVVEVDATGRGRLAGAAGLTGAASYRGEYRFDRVDLVNGAGLLVEDVLVADEVAADGSVEVTGPIETPELDIAPGDSPVVKLGSDLRLQRLVLRSGVEATGRDGDTLHLSVPTLEIEAGAVLHMDARGYAGGVYGSQWGKAPSWVTGAAPRAGGSHGGWGSVSYGGVAPGDVYDSVYAPQLGGGGGSLNYNSSGYRGGNGGGVVDLEVDTLVLDGEIRALGEERRYDYREASGAGGSVWIRATSLTGSGTIDVSGADSRYCGSSDDVSAGGGGRVALEVDGFIGFDPASQVVATGGGRTGCSSVVVAYGAPGTVFVREATSTYGDLFVDQGGLGGLPPLTTQLPAIGSGTVGSAEVDATDPAALWIQPDDPATTFALGVAGAWLRIGNADYRILDQSDDRLQILLADAAGIVSVGDSYEGVYKFDSTTAHGGAVVEFLDTAELGTVSTDADSQVITP